MSEIVDKALAKFNSLSLDHQEEIAAQLIALIDETPYHLSPAERQAVDEGLAAVAAGDVVDETYVQALFAKYRSI